jgi:misacylated tRNA(Ala) deacylase
LILLHTTQTVHGKNCRLYFTAGDRAVGLSTASVKAISSVARLMSCGASPDEILDQVTKLRDTAAELKKKEAKLLLNIAEFEAERVKADLQAGKNAWVYHADGNLEFINKVVSIVGDTAKSCGGVVILAAGEEKKAGPLVIYGKKETVEETVAKAKEIVKEIKGGGKGEKWQGKVPEWKRYEMDALKKLVCS